jgi:ketosteroid isomerase-like protein
MWTTEESMRDRLTNPLIAAVLTVALGLPAAAIAADGSGNAESAIQLRATEEAFAKTMADRDHAAFVSFLAEEAVFFGRRSELRGRDAVAAAWKPLFEGAAAPFSWQPEVATVLDSGTLGLTAGPVFAPDGKRIGTFNSVWRRTSDGSWKIVFDRGCPDCECPPPAGSED